MIAQSGLEHARLHRRTRIRMHELRRPILDDRGLKHLHSKVIDLALLDTVANDLAEKISMIEYVLYATLDHTEFTSVMSQLHTCPGPVATSTGIFRGCLVPFFVATTGRCV